MGVDAERIHSHTSNPQRVVYSDSTYQRLENRQKQYQRFVHMNWVVRLYSIHRSIFPRVLDDDIAAGRLAAEHMECSEKHQLFYRLML